jgi:hypothetical protein
MYMTEHRSLYESTLEHINSRETQLDESYKKEKAEIAEMRRALAGVNGNGNVPRKLASAIKPAADTEPLARPGSKTANGIQLLKRSNGATIKDLESVTKWKKNSVRGWLSGTLKKKMGIVVRSKVGADGQRVYWIGEGHTV